ncbi:MAG: AMP-dependent synthetase, partial [Phototrophicales bacterium]
TFKIGDRIAINMQMNLLSIAIYLAIVKAGCQVVSIAHSFSTSQIEIRTQLTNTTAIIVQESFVRNGKRINLLQKVTAIPNAPRLIVIANADDEPRLSKQ